MFYSSFNPGLLVLIKMICYNALKVLGFVMRLEKDFMLQSAVKVLYCSIERSVLEYGALILNPHTLKCI